MRMINMVQKQFVIYRKVKNKLKPEFSSPTKLKPVLLDIEKVEQKLINEYNAAEKIESYPESIQKLVWRALYYKNEIKTRLPMFYMVCAEDEKLTKFIEAFRQTHQLILKMCKKQNLKRIIIEESFKNICEVK